MNTNCSEKETREVAATGHSWEKDFTIDKKESCKEAGSKSKHCANCDATTEVTVIPMIHENTSTN